MHPVQGAVAAVSAAIAMGVAAPAAAQAPQKFPSKPVRIVVGFSPGSTTDITARMIGPKLSEMWGQPVIVDNRSGAGSTLASGMVAKATPDGHTLLLVSASFAITAVITKNLPYDPLKDLRGVAQIGSTTGLLAVAPQLGVKSVKELIALAQQKPGELLFGSAGPGSGLHMTAERFNLLAGIKVVHVPFRGQPEMLVDMVAGRIHYGVPGLAPAMPFLKDGRLLALAVVNPRRSPLLPNVPAMAEILPEFQRDAAHALMAPSRTPDALVRKISADVARVLELPDVKERMASMSFDPAPTSPEEYDRIVRAQIDVFTKVARSAGLIGK
ncbi:MAG TPA: tripartite tricarboxylate transporter substrate binding protein [Burkholderiales bacterium]|nr:tripartite tricarboxylate transporter substrate binding protein [Burkholderiales bacterium]